MATASAPQADIKRTDKRLTHSEIQTAKTCLRKHRLAYGIGLRQTQSAQPLRFGTAFHEALDIRAKLMSDGQGHEKATAQAREVACQMYDAQGDVSDPEHAVWRVILNTMIHLYDWRWAEQDRGISIVESEISFDIPLRNPDTNAPSRTFTQAGKIDKIVTLPDGRTAIMEHKTAGKDIDPTSDYWKRLRIDSQISYYYIAALELGHEVETILYDVIRKPSIGFTDITQGRSKTLVETGEYFIKGDDGDVSVGRIGSIDMAVGGDVTKALIDGEVATVKAGKKEGTFSIRETPSLYAMRLTHEVGQNPDRYFQRREIPRIESDIEEAQIEIWEEAKRIAFHNNRGVWPRNTNACIGFGKCEYFELCTQGFDPLRDDAPEGFEIRETIHGELEQGE